MGILAWIILGGIAGWIATALTGSQEGCLMNIVLGIVGAVVGGFVFSLIGGAPVTGLNLWSIFVAVVGAVIVLVIVRAVRQRR